MSWHTTVVSGRLSKEPELKYLGSGTALCKLSIPVNERWNDSAGQPQEKTTWYDVTVWGKRAEWCSNYLRKGSVVTVSGNVEARGYKARDGSVRASLDLRAREVSPLADWGGANSGSGNQQAQSKSNGGLTAPRPQTRASSSPSDVDDIPF